MIVDLISLNTARKLGLTHYFTGKPCKYGHIAKRQVSNRSCVICVKKRAITWAKNNPERSKEILDNWNKNNREREAERARKWRAKNPETYKRMVREWREKNSIYYKAYMAKAAMDRQAAKRKRTPSWLTDDDHWMMEQAYELAQLRTDMLGFEWHVDHIVPLRGKDVSGLHAPWNLQVIPAVENLSKSNKFAGI